VRVPPRRIVTKRGSRTFARIMTGPSSGIKSAFRDEDNQVPEIDRFAGPSALRGS
jgi:hypothetical protein